MRWPLPLVPHDDELLSSFLVRAAHRHGLSPYRFCAFHFTGFPIWNRDIDRSASDELLAVIAAKAGLSLERVTQMTLRSAESALGQGVAYGSAAWINRVGIYHRLRRRWGLQYCPDCLAESPVLFQAWRISFVVVCSRHRRLLQDACPHCDAPLATHRQMLSAQLCHHCSHVLGRAPHDPAVSIDTLLRAQFYFERALHGGHVEIGDQLVCGADLLQGARVLAGLLGPTSHPSHDISGHHWPLEQARVLARASILRWLVEVLATWPLEFMRATGEQHLTQRSFVRKLLPPWLASGVCKLPPGRARHAAPKKRHSLRVKLEENRLHNADWRATRAALLWQAVKK